MRKLIVAGSTVIMMAAMGMTSFAANTVSAPSAGPGSYGYCTYIDSDGNEVCDSCANERAHCGHSGHVGACTYAEECDGNYRDGRSYREDCGDYREDCDNYRDDCDNYRDDCDRNYRNDCGDTHRSGSGDRYGRRGHHGGCR